MRSAVLSAVLVACGACSNFDPTGPTPAELYAMVCVDSVASYPTYNCARPPVSIVDSVAITLTIDNPTPIRTDGNWPAPRLFKFVAH